MFQRRDEKKRSAMYSLKTETAVNSCWGKVYHYSYCYQSVLRILFTVEDYWVGHYNG